MRYYGSRLQLLSSTPSLSLSPISTTGDVQHLACDLTCLSQIQNGVEDIVYLDDISKRLQRAAMLLGALLV